MVYSVIIHDDRNDTIRILFLESEFLEVEVESSNNLDDLISIIIIFV